MSQARKTKLLLVAMKVAAVNSAFDMHIHQTSYETELQKYLKDALVMLDDLVKEENNHVT